MGVRDCVGMTPLHTDPRLVLQKNLHAFAALDRRDLTKVGRGAFVRTAQWDDIFRDDRQRIVASDVWRRVDRSSGAFAMRTALAIHGLPVFGGRDDRVDLIVPGANPRHGSSQARRHHCALPEFDVSVIDGMRVTSIERTLYDVIRLESIEAAVIALDAAFHRAAWDDQTNTYDRALDAALRDGIHRRIVAGSGARGIRQARIVLDFADGRAASPGESLLRLRTWQVGIDGAEPQFRVELGAGRYALLDLAFSSRRIWFEFDGDVKLTDPAMLRGRTAADVLAEQAARRDAVARVLQWTPYQYGWNDVLTLDAYAGALRARGIRP